MFINAVRIHFFVLMSRRVLLFRLRFRKEQRRNNVTDAPASAAQHQSLASGSPHPRLRCQRVNGRRRAMGGWNRSPPGLQL